jgi:UDP-glucose 4-epimerase
MPVLITGGAGFIGSHFVEHFLATTDTTVTVLDNFSSGKRWRLPPSDRLRTIEADLRDLDSYVSLFPGHDLVVQLASNPDIARAATEPDIDFWQGTFLVQNVLEAMRRTGVRRLIYASGSGVYGDIGDTPLPEDFGPLQPISTYGASKLGCEALISAYSAMFGIQAWVFRFANVVGGRQTHGVGYDFIRKLRRDPTRLEILGDGRQSKSYIHVSDIIAAIQHVVGRVEAPYSVHNVATDDYLTVTEIGEIAVKAMGLTDVRFEYTGGDRGWKGDVPVVRFNLDRIHRLGWRASLGSYRAMERAIGELIADLDAHGDAA